MHLARFALGLLLLLVAIRPAFAQDEVATVRLDGQAVFQVGPTSDGDDAAARARRIEARLSGLLRNLNALAPPVARQTSAGWPVNVSGIPVVTVTPRDAEDNLTPPPALAVNCLDRRTLATADHRACITGAMSTFQLPSAKAAGGLPTGSCRTGVNSTVPERLPERTAAFG